MRLASRALALMPTLLVLCAAVSAQTSRQTDEPKPAVPTVGTNAPAGGPTSLFTIYDGGTLRKGEYTFSVAYSNYDRDPGDVDITVAPFSLNIGLSDYFELFFGTEGYRAVNVNNSWRLSGSYLPNSQLFFGANRLGSGPAIILSPERVNGTVVPSNAQVFRPAFNQPFVQFPFVGGTGPTFGIEGSYIAPRFVSRLGAAANFPSYGSPCGSILPGIMLTTRMISPHLTFNTLTVPDLFTTCPTYIANAPFNNRLYGESSFSTVNVGKFRLIEPGSPFDIGFVGFYRWYPDRADDASGFNQLQRGASPGAGIFLGDIGVGGFSNGQLSSSVNLPGNTTYILNSNLKSNAFGADDILFLYSPYEPLSAGSGDFPDAKHFQVIAELKSVHYVDKTPNSSQNSQIDFQQAGFGSRHFIGRSNPRASAILPNQPPDVKLSSSSTKVVLGVGCEPDGVQKTNCAPASMSVRLMAEASDPDGDTLLYMWTTTGGRISGDGPNVTWDLSGVQPGTYTATVEVDDGVGCIALTSATVTVEGIEHPVREVPGDLMTRDKIHSAADQLFREGIRLQSKGTAPLLQEAVVKYKEALSNWKKINDTAGMIITYQKLAEVHYSLGEYQQTIVSYTEALSLTRATGDRKGEASTLSNIGELYNDLADYPKALDYLTKALKISEEVSDRQALADTLYGLGEIYFNQGKINESLVRYERSLNHFREVQDRRGETLALHGLGKVYASLGEHQKALDSYNQAKTLARSVDNKTVIVASVLFDIGRTYRALGDNQKALDYYKESLNLNSKSVDRNREVRTLYEIALATRSIGDLDKSREHIEAALNIVDSLRINIPSSELRSAYFASVQECYGFYIDLLVQLHEQRPPEGFDVKALEASERARARSLLELLTEARTDIRQGIDSRLIDSERSTRQELNNIAARQIRLLSRRHSEEAAAALATEIEELSKRYRDIQEQIGVESPHYAALTRPQALSLKEIRDRVLDDDTLLLEYFLGEERSFLFAVTSESISVHELPKREVIESAAIEAYQLLSARNRYSAGEVQKERQARMRLASNSYKDVSRRLSRMLLEPVAKQLSAKRLLIVAHGALQYVPFGALPAPNSTAATKGIEYLPLILDHEVINLPSASTLAVLRRETHGRKPPPKTVAVLADPVVSKQDERIAASADRHPATNSGGNADDKTYQNFSRLLGARWEANQIASLVVPSESMLALDFSANRATAVSPDLAKYRIVHFATHGFINEEHPQLSGIVLSLFDKQGRPENGFLRLNDIYNMELPVDLVVLSGCTTGFGKDTKGEGLNGLTRGFMYAGARRVVFSLWSVDDRATADLMVRFYRKMLAEKLSPAAALRGAQIEMWRDRRWNSPYYWAAFMIQGEFK